MATAPKSRSVVTAGVLSVQVVPFVVEATSVFVVRYAMTPTVELDANEHQGKAKFVVFGEFRAVQVIPSGELAKAPVATAVSIPATKIDWPDIHLTGYRPGLTMLVESVDVRRVQVPVGSVAVRISPVLLIAHQIPLPNVTPKMLLAPAKPVVRCVHVPVGSVAVASLPSAPAATQIPLPNATV